MADSAVTQLEQAIAGVTVSSDVAKPLYETIEDITSAIKSGKIKNIVVMTGAGASVPAGIPDFRSPGTGLYENLQEFDLPYPEAMFSKEYFARRPQPFYTLVQELFPGKYRPAKAHYFVRLLEKKGLLVRDYTQNIDELERLAGVSEEKVIEAHGTFATASCSGEMCNCHRRLPLDSFIAAMYESDHSLCQCPACGLPVKPDIVFFGESLPHTFDALREPDLTRADLVIVMGTSLKVEPFNKLVKLTGPAVPRLLINRDKVGYNVGLFAHEADPSVAQRDVHLGGDIDGQVQDVCQLLGWAEDLAAVEAEEQARFDERAQNLLRPAPNPTPNPADLTRVALLDGLAPPNARLVDIPGVCLSVTPVDGPNPIGPITWSVGLGDGAAGAVVYCTASQLALLESHYGVPPTIIKGINVFIPPTHTPPVSRRKAAEIRAIPVDPDAHEELPTWSYTTTYRPLMGHWGTYCTGYEAASGIVWTATPDLLDRVKQTVGIGDAEDEEICDLVDSYMTRPLTRVDIRLTLFANKKRVFAVNALNKELDGIAATCRQFIHEEAELELIEGPDPQELVVRVTARSYNPNKAGAFVERMILSVAGKYVDQAELMDRILVE